MSRILELRQQRAKLIADMGEYTAKASAEKRSLNAEELEKFNKMLAEEKSLRSTIEAIETQEGLQRSLEQATEQRNRHRTNNPEITEDIAFAHYLRHGDDVGAEYRSHLRVGREERDGNVVGTNSAGGYTVPTTFMAELLKVEKTVAGPYQVARVITTDSGNPIDFPTTDDTSNSTSAVAENTTISGTDFTFGQVVLGAYKYPAMAKLSLELVSDSGLNIVAEVANLLGERNGRALNRDFTVGDGSGKAKGFLSVGKAFTSSSASDFTYVDLVGLKYSIDAAYRVKGVWQMNDQSFAHCLTLHDSNNRPLITPAFGAVSEQLFGQAVILNNNMPDLGSTASVHATPIAYGDFSKYLVRVVNGPVLRVLNELYAEKDMVAYRITQRVDGKLSISSAVAVMSQPLAS